MSDDAEMADFGERMTGFPAVRFENPQPLPPCSHCGDTASRQPYIDRPLQCPRSQEPVCWTCSKRGLVQYHEEDRR